MKKVTIRIHRPIEGTIVFTLMGAEGKTFTASEIFRCNHAFVPLIPNSLYPGSYYEYKVYTQWHRCWCGITSEPIEKGYCVVPDHDAALEDIIKSEDIENVYATKKELEDAIAELQQTSPEECSCPEYQGATEEADGVSGLVPAATTEEANYFLTGNGTWTDLLTRINQLEARIEALEPATVLVSLGNIWVLYSWASLGNNTEIKLNETYDLLFQNEYLENEYVMDEESFIENANFSIGIYDTSDIIDQNVNNLSSVEFDISNNKIKFSGQFDSAAQETFGFPIAFEGWVSASITRITNDPNYNYQIQYPSTTEGSIVGQIKLSKVNNE